MSATASSIITRANQIARTINYKSQALAELNSLLNHIAATLDFSAARGQWNFTFATALVTSGGGGIISAAPNPLPLDYLRVQTSGGSTGAQRSSKWYFQGVPYDMVEIDLTEWDDQVQQAGIQSYPYFWAKDLAPYNPVIEITGTLTAGSAAVTAPAIIDSGSSLAAVATGLSVSGGLGPVSAITPGTTILAVNNPLTTITLSAPATASLTGATLLIGNPGNGYPYPPPSGAYPGMIRYQRRMPRLTQAQVDAGAYCWFSDGDTLVDGLAGRMMGYSGDSRAADYAETARKKLAQYTKLADDNANRAQGVQLDRRRFGTAFANLPNTKTVGW